MKKQHLTRVGFKRVFRTPHKQSIQPADPQPLINTSSRANVFALSPAVLHPDRGIISRECLLFEAKYLMLFLLLLVS
jgi:hypothetical protein